MNDFMKIGLGVVAGIIIHRIYIKRKSGSLPANEMNSKLETIQMDLHNFLSDLYQGKANEKDIEAAVLDIVK